MFDYTTTSVCGHLTERDCRNRALITARRRRSVRQGAELSLSEIMVNATQIIFVCLFQRSSSLIGHALLFFSLLFFYCTSLCPADSFITVKSLFEKVPSLFANARATGSHWAATLLVIRHKLNYWPSALAPHKALLATSSPCGVLWTRGSKPLSCYCSPSLGLINFISTRLLEDVKKLSEWQRGVQKKGC